MRDGVLHGAVLRDANLEQADFRGADLSFADLRGANLAGANLEGTNFQAADLQGTDFQDAQLKGINLRGAIISDYTNLQGVVWGDDFRSLAEELRKKWTPFPTYRTKAWQVALALMVVIGAIVVAIGVAVYFNAPHTD